MKIFNFQKMTIYLILYIVNCDFAVAEMQSQKNYQKYFNQMNEKAALTVKQESMRNTSTYQRVKQLCLHPNQMKSYSYVLAASGQVFSVSGGEVDAFRTAISLGSTVSPLLTFDLQQDAFYFALDECGYSESGKNWFVASLIAQDISGKFAAGLGLVGMAKLSLKVIKFIKQKSKRLFYGLSAASIAGLIYQTLKQYNQMLSADVESLEPSPHSTPVTLEQFESHLKIDQLDAENERLRLSVLDYLESKRIKLENVINSTTDQNLKYQKNQELKKLNLKIKFIKQSKFNTQRSL